MSSVRLVVMLSAAMFIGVGLFVILLVRASRHLEGIGKQYAALAPLLREREVLLSKCATGTIDQNTLDEIRRLTLQLRSRCDGFREWAAGIELEYVESALAAFAAGDPGRAKKLLRLIGRKSIFPKGPPPEEGEQD